MFKGFQSKSKQFNSFPALNFQMNNEAYGFSGCTFWLDAAYGLNTQTNLASVSSWTDKISNLSFTQPSAGSQPRLVTSNPSYNNFPTIESNSSGQKLINSVQKRFGKTIAFVANYSSLQTTNPIFSRYQTLSSGTVGWVAAGGSFTGINGIAIRQLDTSFVSGTTENTSVKICVITPNSIYVNGVQESSTYNQIDQFSCGIIFGVSTTLNDTLIGNLAELIFWEANYAGRETEISDALNTKYAIY